MRGLTDAGPSRGPASAQAVITAAAVLAALALFAVACGTGGTGARDEGPAHADSVGNAPAAKVPAPNPSQSYDKINAVALVKADPAVSATVKRDLKPCSGNAYPVDVTYGNLTGGTVDDVVVNVLTCGDAGGPGFGVGAYVYRNESGAYLNVFKAEESPVYAEIDKGDLSVTKQVYEKGDPVSSPSGENVITYSWAAGHFVQQDFHHTDYGNAAGGDTQDPSGTS
ncbi:hypothetical protein EDD90_4928 [Streptomyces sp. Ag109_O5-1]|uniref:hypothetical protein n=1 Tax=Streptomyces sp. Ag109_O5-1 TaxID=1938851 RepID=UPI000F4DD3D4|nr:hypothetical protein [Streptomyces sp. Ag109_O5-1]RPE41832.1 hypothetical protein EDD90_4928 [Streptomyces sp. Ag109_O5-1]